MVYELCLWELGSSYRLHSIVITSVCMHILGGENHYYSSILTMCNNTQAIFFSTCEIWDQERPSTWAQG